MDSKYEWSLAPVVTDTKQLMRAIYRQRGIVDNQGARRFLQPSQVLEPTILPNLSAFVARIRQAVAQQEQITVYGDYDVDGLTATMIMVETLRKLGAKVNHYLPKRGQDGYGPNAVAYARLQAQGTQLIVTVDNGVSGADVIDPLSGMDVIISDHHTLPAQLPHCVIVHPGLSAASQGSRVLSGAGVAFKIAWALLGQLPLEMLDLVALGEIADVMPMTGENRWLVKRGLQQLAQTKRPGLQQLLAAQKLAGQRLVVSDIGFSLAPVFNAVGRLADAEQVWPLLAPAGWYAEAKLTEIVDEAIALNNERKAMTANLTQATLTLMQTSADSQAEGQPDGPYLEARPGQFDHPALVITGVDLPAGLVGIVAGRVQDQTGKPTLVLSRSAGSGHLSGSGRAPAGFDLYQALSPHPAVWTRFGGHAGACGIGLTQEQLPGLQAVLDQAAQEQGFGHVKKPTLPVSAIVTPQLLTKHTFALITALEPFDKFKNREPILVLRGMTLSAVRAIGSEHQYLSFRLGDLRACWFASGVGVLAEQLSSGQYDIAGHLVLNQFRGQTKVELFVDDLQTAKRD